MKHITLLLKSGQKNPRPELTLEERNDPHPLTPFPPLIINACITGMIPNKDKTAFVPISTDEIIEDAVKVYDAGARAIHFHARDKEGKPTWKAEIYEKILTGVRRERPEVICCVSCSGRNWPDFEHRTEVLHLTGMAKPDMASLTLGSLNFPTGPSINSMDMVQSLAQLMAEKEIRPELEVFDLGMIGFANYLEKKGVFFGRKYFNLLLGSLGSISATIGNLAILVEALPQNSYWAAAGIGSFQLTMNMAAIIAGGGVRVGIEDNIYYDSKRKKLASNEELVRRVVWIAEELERTIATPEEARVLVGID